MNIMKNTVVFILLGIILFSGLYFLIASEYASATLDTVQKVVSGILFITFIVGIFWASTRKTKG